MDSLTKIFQGKVMGLESPNTGEVQMEQNNMEQNFSVGETAEQEANRKIGLSFGTPKTGYELTGLGGGGPTIDINAHIGLGSSGGAKSNINEYLTMGSGSNKKINPREMLGGGKMKKNNNVSGYFNMGKKKAVNMNDMMGGKNTMVSNMLGASKMKGFNMKSMFDAPKSKAFDMKGMVSKPNNKLQAMMGGKKNGASNMNKFLNTPTPKGNMAKVSNEFGFWNNAKQHIIKNPAKIGMTRVKQQKGLSMFGDRDKDGVANILDCQPLNYFKQGIEEKFNEEDLKDTTLNTEEAIKKQGYVDEEPETDEDKEWEKQVKKLEQEQKLVESQQKLLTAETELQSAELGVEKTKMDLNAQIVGHAKQIKFDSEKNNMDFNKQMLSNTEQKRDLARQDLKEDIMVAQDEKSTFKKITGIPSWKEWKNRAVLKQSLRDDAKQKNYADLYRKEQELKLAEKYSKGTELLGSKTKEIVTDAKGKRSVKYSSGSGRVSSSRSSPSRNTGAANAIATGLGAFGGRGGAMGGADMLGSSGMGVAMMSSGAGSGAGFGVMLGQQASGQGMAQMVGGPSTGRGFANMAGIKIEEPEQPQMQQMSPQGPPQQSQPVGPPPSPDGKVWSPHSKKYVTYTRGQYDKDRPQPMYQQPQQY